MSAGEAECSDPSLILHDGGIAMPVQKGTGRLDVDFSSISISEGGLSEDIAREQQIRDISRRRMELEVMEIELKSQVIARSEILEIQNRYEEQIKENATAAQKLKEQLQEKEQRICNLERGIQEKERELRAIKIDTEVACAEQTNELASFRRERDSSEAEKVVLLKQIHDLQQHFHDKETQFLELQEKHRVIQETVLYKDKQIREAQAWIAHVQMDALQSTANQSLQAELRERTEQFNQYWTCLVQQFTDMERHLLQVIQQLQVELAEAKGRSAAQPAHAHSNEPSIYPESKRNEQPNTDANGTTSDSSAFLSNGIVNHPTPLVSASEISTKVDFVPQVPIFPPALGMQPLVSPAQLNALHPFIVHPQGTVQSASSTNLDNFQSQLGQLLSISPNPNWSNQQEKSEASHVPTQNQHELSQTGDERLQSDALYSYGLSSDRQVNHPDHSKSSGSPIKISESSVGSFAGLEVSNDHPYSLAKKSMESSRDYSIFTSSSGDAQQDESTEEMVGSEISDSGAGTSHQLTLKPEKRQLGPAATVSDGTRSGSSSEVSECDTNTLAFSGICSVPRTSNPSAFDKTSSNLLDEKLLLACIVRAVPSGVNNRIRISSTLPNRLDRMLAPLHWHDYRDRYGKLDEFVGSHPELFVIEGDYIHLREGAQKIVSANTAAAKFAAATAASGCSLPQSVVVTPVAQGHRSKRSPFTYGDSISMGNALPPIGRNSQPMNRRHQQMNGLSIGSDEDLSVTNSPIKSKDFAEANALSSDRRTGQLALNGTVGDDTGVHLQSKTFSNGRHVPGKRQQGRVAGVGPISRR